MPILTTGVLSSDSLSGLGRAVLSVGDTATADDSLVLVKSTLASHLGSVRVDGGLVGLGAAALKTGASGLLATVVVELVGGHALHRLAEASVDVGGGLTAEGVGGGDLVARGLRRGVLHVGSEGCIGRGRAGREGLCAELGDGVVAGKDTRLVLLMQC